jgi:AraC-like DNA-binding protein
LIETPPQSLIGHGMPMYNVGSRAAARRGNPQSDMDSHSSAFNLKDQNFADMAKQWGYEYEILSVEGRAPRPSDEQPLVEGTVTTADLRCGTRICVSSLLSTRDNDRAGDFSRSLMLVLALEGTPLQYHFDRHRRIALDPGRLATFAVADQARLVARYRRGDRTRSVVLQVSPDELGDEQLADAVNRLLSANSATAAVISDRVRRLAYDLFSPRYTGVAGRLLAESCALELIAGAIHPDAAAIEDAGHGMKPTDVARMIRLRDMLINDLGAEHSLSSLAREAGVSVSTLKSKFRAVVGQPLFAFLRDQRLERARYGLMHEEWTVAHASSFVGYRHPTNFATAFRRKFGCSPQGAGKTRG